MAKQKQTAKRPPKKRLVSAAMLLIAGAVLIAFGVYHNWHRSTAHCQEVTTEVTLAEDDPTTYNVAGEICAKGSLTGKTVQLLISGHTYDSTYWDFEHEPDTYSYVKAALDAGYATYNIDRVGVGDSDLPADPATLTTPSQAYVTKQLVDALRSGKLADTQDSKIVLVGHSLGSAIALYEAGAYGDVDAVVSAGLGATNPAFIPTLQTYQYPANQDSKFANMNLPDGYITTKPGDRGKAFYNTDYAEQAVIDTDEAAKQPGTPQAIITIPEARSAEIADNVRTPVFFTVGEKDALYCNEDNPGLSCKDKEAVINREKQYFPNACLDAYVQPNSGHDGNLHPDAPDMFKAVNDWITAWVGKTSSDEPAKSC